MKMKKSFGFVLLILLAGFLFADEPFKLDPLPAPLSNNAVTSANEITVRQVTNAVEAVITAATYR